MPYLYRVLGLGEEEGGEEALAVVSTALVIETKLEPLQLACCGWPTFWREDLASIFISAKYPMCIHGVYFGFYVYPSVYRR